MKRAFGVIIEERLAGPAAALAIAASSAHAGTLLVPADFATIQDAVDAAIDGDEVVLADGTYVEDVEILDLSVTLRSQSGNRDLCVIDGQFTGLNIVGGLTGDDVTVRDLTIRDCPTRAVVIGAFASVDLRNCVIADCTNIGGMFMSGEALTMIDCLVRDNASSSGGAGLVISAGDVTISNTIFRDNDASGNSPYGGGVAVSGDASVLIFDSVFRRNTAIGTVAGRGGGLGVQGGSAEPVMIANTVFDDNESNDRGGGMYIEYRGAVLGNVEFTSNVGLAGGAMFLENSGGAPVQFTISNALIADNDATNGSGGGIRLNQDATLTVTNATIFRNTATGFAGGGVAVGPNSSGTFTNCIVGGNTPNDFAGAGTIAVTYSDVEDGFAGAGNISQAPLFVDINAGDYRLTSGSPCIDAGNTLACVGPAMDLDGLHRVAENPDAPNTGLALLNGAIDMGAYEFQPADSCASDLDSNGVVGAADLAQLLATWGTCP
jgi:hypothetical protein